jgi:hypothetical protein
MVHTAFGSILWVSQTVASRNNSSTRSGIEDVSIPNDRAAARRCGVSINFEHAENNEAAS